MIVAIIQARTGSKRLPKKVFLPLGDTTVLGSTVRQVKKAKTIDRVIVATSIESDDDLIERHCEDLGVECFRGSLNDVLDRYYMASKETDADVIVRITADCPLIDPDVIDLVVEEFKRDKKDYVSNGFMESTYPTGMDVEVVSFDALEEVWKEAILPSDREHVMTYFWTHPDRFRIREIKSPDIFSGIRVTLDEPEDYDVLKRVVENVRPLSLGGIVEYFRKHPEVTALNARFVRNEGYSRSLEKSDTSA
jgi:spore coat polysaccharide biosynthesis protein SpsF